MDKMRNYIIGFMIGVATAIVLSLFLILNRCDSKQVVATPSVGITIDTVYVERTRPPINITSPGKITYTSRSKITEQPDDTLSDNLPDTNEANILLCDMNLFDTAATFFKPYSHPIFWSVLDTIYLGDTIKVVYRYPENIFDMSYYPKTDSLMISQILVQQGNEK